MSENESLLNVAEIQNKEENEVEMFMTKQNSEKFLISVNGEPKFYTDTIEEAKEKIKTAANMLLIFENFHNKCYIHETENPNVLEMYGHNPYSIVNVDKRIYVLEITEIKQIGNEVVSENITDDEYCYYNLKPTFK